MQVNLTWNCRACVGVFFSLFAVRMLAKPYHLGVNWPTTHCEIKDGYISLPSILNAIITITSYYCVILKIVILHDGIKTIQNEVFLFSLKKRTKSGFFYKKLQKTFFFFKQKNPGGLFFFEKPGFFSTLPAFHAIIFCLQKLFMLNVLVNKMAFCDLTNYTNLLLKLTC